MNIRQFEYQLPKELIAHSPCDPRDHSRLMVIDRETHKITHKKFYNLANLLGPKDVLVFNQSKVFPAKLIGMKPTSGKIEILLVEEMGPNKWSAIHKGKIEVGQKILFDDVSAIVTKKDFSDIELKFFVSDFWEWLYAYGQVPLPPYIKSRSEQRELRKLYQTVYAKLVGSVAAPTAGFHFTVDLINSLKNKGVQMEYITLHVGLGTFLPVKTSDLTKHKMHAEQYILDPDTAARLNRAKKDGKRIISVGTTTARVLESSANTPHNKLKSGAGKTNIFIYPPYKFKFVDALITNFHLPHSTLLALVSAFVSYPNTPDNFTDFKSTLMGKAYAEAIKKGYRFYSFGDASIIT